LKKEKKKKKHKAVVAETMDESGANKFVFKRY